MEELLSCCFVLQSGTDELLLVPTTHWPEVIVRSLGNDGGYGWKVRRHHVLSHICLVMSLKPRSGN